MDLPTRDTWANISFWVDSKNVMNYEGFVRFEVEDEKIKLDPFGLELTVQSLTSQGVVLELDGQIFVADCSVDEKVVELTVVRKGCRDVVSIRAEFSEKPMDLPARVLSR